MAILIKKVTGENLLIISKTFVKVFWLGISAIISMYTGITHYFLCIFNCWLKSFFAY